MCEFFKTMKTQKKKISIDMLEAALYNIPRAPDILPRGNTLKQTQIQESAQQLQLERTSKLAQPVQNETESLFAAFMRPQLERSDHDSDAVESFVTVRRSMPVPRPPLPKDECKTHSRFRHQEDDLILSILKEIEAGMKRNERHVSNLKKKQKVRLKPETSF